VNVTSRVVPTNAITGAQWKNSYTHMRDRILKRRYLKKNKDGKVTETEDQMYCRAANTMAAVEAKYGATETQVRAYADRFYQLMKNYKFLPNTPTLMNANLAGGMLSACFVLPVEDSIEGIFEAVKQTALIQKAGGGTGFSFDRLRPTGDRVASSGGTTSGPISFWRVFSETTDAIQQGAFRRGANMGMMSVDHPDILKFLNAKQSMKAFANFNISVKIGDDWMKTLFESGSSLHIVKNPRTQQQYLLPRRIDIKDYTINDLYKFTGKLASVPAEANQFYAVSDIWEMIAECAYRTGDPGVVFIDRINRDNPTPSLGQIEATNPCGEQPLLPYEACTLGSINLTKFVTLTNCDVDMDWPALAETINLAVRFLDNTIDVCNYPVGSTTHLAQGNRKIGLGIMGFADALILLGIRYNSEEAVNFADKLACFIQKHAHQASEELAKEKGCFPNWKTSIWGTKHHRPMRNAACTTIAPTGSISIIAGCSSGIEPVFSLVYERKLEEDKFVVVHPLFKQVAREQGFCRPSLMKEILRQGSLKNIKGVPEEIRCVFVTALEIEPRWHVRMQSVFQKHTDNAVSKTVNLPQSSSVQDVKDVFLMAWHMGCKGVTVYRDGSNPDQVLVAGIEKAEGEQKL